MVALRERMLERYADWQSSLPQNTDWPDFFAECPPVDFAGIGEEFEIAEDASIWPGLRDAPVLGAPEGAHICRAFDSVEPGNVQVVVLGKDPYPRQERATGRAFEDGAWVGERTEEVAGSLKSLILASLATRNGHANLFQTGTWPEVRRQIRDEELVFPALIDHFNSLTEQGVIFINAAWTRTSEEHIFAHRKLWKPVLNYMLKKLGQEDQPVVFLLLGSDAREAFCAAEPVCNCSAIVDSAHPRSPQFLQSYNPLVRVSEALDMLGAQVPIVWWPFEQGGVNNGE